MVSILTAPGGSSFGSAHPTNHYGVGLLRFGNGVAWDEPVPIIGGPQRVVPPVPSSAVAYTVFGDGVIEIFEIGNAAGSVFSNLDGTSTFNGAAITISWDNPGAHFDDWITVQPVGTSSPTLNRVYGPDGWARCGGCDTGPGGGPIIEGECSSTLVLPGAGGTYEVRLWHDSPAVLIATGAPMTIA